MADAKPKMVKKAKAPAAYPPFSLMVKEAIVTLKERTGSSTQAIAKFIGGKYGSKMPSNWTKILSICLKRLTESKKLVKVKASYKLGEAMKKATVVNKKKVVVKAKKPAAKKTTTAKKPAAAKAKKPAAKKPAAKKPAAPKAKKPAAVKAKKPAAPKKAKIAAKGGVKKVKTAKKAAPKKKAPAPKA